MLTETKTIIMNMLFDINVGEISKRDSVITRDILNVIQRNFGTGHLVAQATSGEC